MMTITTRTSHFTVTAILFALLASGCGQSDTKQAANPPAAADRTAAAPAPKISGSGEFNNAAALLLDGITPADQSAFDSEQCVHWVDPAVGFVIDLGEVRRVTGVTLQVDNNDDYVLEASRDGAVYAAYATIPATAGANEWGMETHSTLAAAPAEARYLRLRGSEGDGAYGVSEVRVASESLAPGATASVAEPSSASGSGSAAEAARGTAATSAAAPAGTVAAAKPSELVGFSKQDAQDVTLEQAFDAVDANHDGKLTKTEYAAIWKDKSGVDDNFANFDYDHSGYIEKQEYLSFPDRLRAGK
ncbi:MAG: discoidin domain-containing protein [Candidatus Latescibacteria bacterium]|nr:discoidin domain-containing protein [Candidatus Latescibacterota bacterium]